MNKKIVIITGLSGAGKSTALKIFEDMGYEAVDNLPCSLLPLILNEKIKSDISIGIDIRSRDFDAKKINRFILKIKEKLAISVIFFDCENIKLIERFKVSRRRHPMSLNIPINDIIEQERFWLKPLKDIADFQLDTTNLEVPELNKTLLSIFSKLNDQKLNLRIMSFGFKHGIPREADIVMDVRFLENPYYDKSLRVQNGKDNDVIKFVKSQSCFEKFHKNFLNTINHLFKFYKIEGKKYLTIAFGCTGGVHRSVVVAETIFDSLARSKLGLYIDHRDIEK